MAEGMPGKDMPVYPIGTVERLTGLTARQIRYYEGKGLVMPARTQGKQRLYSQHQVDRLVKVRKLMAEGYNLKSIRELLEEEERRSPLDRLEEYPAAGRMARAGLQSLYPVTDAARLMRMLELRQEQDPRRR